MQPNPLKKSSFLTRGNKGAAWFIILIVLVLAAGIGAGLWHKYHSTAVVEEDKNFIADAAHLAPPETQAFAAVDFRAFGWDDGTVRAVARAVEKDKSFADFRSGFQAKFGFEFNEETMSWLAPRAVAVYVAPAAADKPLFKDFQGAAAAGGIPEAHFLIVMQMNDKARMVSFLGKLTELFTKDSKIPFKDETYKDVTLHEPSDAGKAPCWAIDEGFVLVSLTPEVVKDAIDRRSTKGSSLADNEAYKKSLSHFQRTDGVAVYTDFRALMTGVPAEDMIPNILERRLLQGIDWMGVGGGRENDGALLSEWMLHTTYPDDFAVAKKILPPQHPSELKAAQLMPENSEMFMSLDLRTLWDTAYALMGEDPELAPMRDMPEMKLKEMGIDLKTDVLDVLSGEVAYSAEGLDRVMESYTTKPTADGQEGAASPIARVIEQQPGFVVAVGFTDKDKFDAILNRVGGPMLATFTPENYKDVTISSQGDSAYAEIDNTFVMAMPHGSDKIHQIIDARASGHVLAKTAGYQRFAQVSGGSHPLMVFYYELEKYYQTIAKGMEKDNPLWADYLRHMGDKISLLWGNVVLRADGISSVSLSRGR